MEFSAKNNLKIGLFVAIGLIVVMGSIFTLGGDKSLFTNYVKIHAKFENVQGLAKGSIVSLSGVVVGNIQEIRFVSEENVLDVIMKVESEYLSKIPVDSKVEIRTQGALGDKFIFIIPGTNRAESMKDGGLLGIAPATDIFNIVAERGKETEKVFDIINEVLILMKSINKDNQVAHIVSNMNQASSNLNQTSAEVKKFMAEFNANSNAQKMRSTVEKLESIINKIDRGQGTLGALVNDSTVHDQLKAILGGAQRKNHVRSVIRTSIEKSEGD